MAVRSRAPSRQKNHCESSCTPSYMPVHVLGTMVNLDNSTIAAMAVNPSASAHHTTQGTYLMLARI